MLRLPYDGIPEDDSAVFTGKSSATNAIVLLLWPLHGPHDSATVKAISLDSKIRDRPMLRVFQIFFFSIILHGTRMRDAAISWA